MVQHHAVPLPFVVEEPVGVLEAAALLIPQGRANLLPDRLKVVLQHLADGELRPRLARPDRLAAEATDPDLGGVLEVVPRDGLSRGVGPDLAIPGHLGHPLEECLCLINHPGVFVLQRCHLRIERHATALQLGLLVKVLQALLVPHELVRVLQPSLDKVIVTGGAVEDVLHRVQVEEEVGHVLQLPEVVRGGQDVADAVQSQLAVLGVVLVFDVRPQLRNARMPQLPLLAVKLPVRMREESVLPLLVAAITGHDLDVRGAEMPGQKDHHQCIGDECGAAPHGPWLCACAGVQATASGQRGWGESAAPQG
mmetsp:Transcript_108694/g.346549  ORF Transcript_108694/g.346549 Transcript_108694/m.346549 type:complete len:309 (-) Transcript_108694:17-943(-)